MIVFVNINTAVHRITDVGVSHHSVGVATVIDVSDDHAGIGFGNTDVREQRLAVLNPNTGDHGPSGARTIVDGDALNQTARAAPDVHGSGQDV